MVRMLFIAHLLASVLFEWAGANLPLINTEATECESVTTNCGYFCLWTLLSPSEFSENECCQTSSDCCRVLILGPAVFDLWLQVQS